MFLVDISKNYFWKSGILFLHFSPIEDSTSSFLEFRVLLFSGVG